MTLRQPVDSGSTPIWARPEPPARRTPHPLSRELIVGAALELADADGLEGVSIRRVAAALEVGPMRLYGYVDTKDELLDLMADAVYAEIVPPAAHLSPDWRAGLRLIAGLTRRAALRHEWFPELLGGRPHLGPHALAALEARLSVLSTVPNLAGRPAALRRAAAAFHAYLVGALRTELAERQADRVEGRSEEQWRDAMSPYLRRVLDEGRHPHLAELVVEGEHPTPGAEFEAGLEIVLDGIAAQVS
ncbi:TetR/AcrR family transcriptional regulator [Kitasatospora griseola]|uniref:TetR/AcrR family transcriptional regulator n=1 Tax=Kitasatospora griseola TaxID=2064 RepID=UPI0005C45959|nr:TetR/AcrR family transcriptional regulator C-terminal domain-containing protein [Kitasatospora griseola]